jgi:uncharacterized damage-inducible protein DinB
MILTREFMPASEYKLDGCAVDGTKNYNVGMSSPQPDQSLFLLETLLGGLRSEQPVTRRVIEAMPADKSDYRPDAVSKTGLELAWHIVNTERMFMDGIAKGGFDFTPFPKPEAVTTPAALGDWYSKMFDEKADALTKLSSEQLSKSIDFHGMFQLPAVAYLTFATKHSIHHRGQLSMYLRPMGAKVPAIYGESHDSALAKKA